MPEADFSKFLQQAYWRLDRLLAWIAYRGAKWSWDNSWPPEIAKAFGLLMTALKKGTARGSRRLGKTGLRHPIEPYEWCDVELLRYGNPRFYGQEEPRFYDKNTPAQQHYAATAEPWIDVLFEVESALKAFPATPEAPPDKAVGTLRTQGRKKKKQPAPPYSYENLVLFFEKRRKSFDNRDDGMLAAREHFDHKIPVKTCYAAYSKAGLVGRSGPKPKAKKPGGRVSIPDPSFSPRNPPK